MPDLLRDQTGAIAPLTCSRPESRNALSTDMRTLLIQSLHALEMADSVRCIVLKGAGEHFMAGGDVKAMATLLQQPPVAIRNQVMLRIHDLHPIMFALRRLPKPIIASVAGAAAGAGVSLALAAHLVSADENAYFTLAYCHLGTSPDGGASFQLPRAVGIKKAMEIALLGDRHTARAAQAMGLINFVANAGELPAQTAQLAQRLAQGPTHAYGNTKRLLYRSLANDFEAQLQFEAENFAECATRADFKEGVTAFVEKRPAHFTGR